MCEYFLQRIMGVLCPYWAPRILQHFHTVFLVTSSPLQETVFALLCSFPLLLFIANLLACLRVPSGTGTNLHICREASNSWRNTWLNYLCYLLKLQRLSGLVICRGWGLVGQENSFLMLVKFSWTNDWWSFFYAETPVVLFPFALSWTNEFLLQSLVCFIILQATMYIVLRCLAALIKLTALMRMETKNTMS